MRRRKSLGHALVSKSELAVSAEAIVVGVVFRLRRQASDVLQAGPAGSCAAVTLLAGGRVRQIRDR